LSKDYRNLLPTHGAGMAGSLLFEEKEDA
jgi:hypothetical protein